MARQLATTQFSLRWLNLMVLIVALYLALLVSIPSAWFSLFLLTGGLAFCFAYPPIYSRFWLALVFTSLHAALMFTVALIEFGPGFDDQNATFLVLMAAHYAELPATLALDYLPMAGDQRFNELRQTLPYIVGLGSIFWFAAGWVLGGAIWLVNSRGKKHSAT